MRNNAPLSLFHVYIQCNTCYEGRATGRALTFDTLIGLNNKVACSPSIPLLYVRLLVARTPVCISVQQKT